MIKINLNQFIIYNLKSYDYIRIMDEDELCLICLDETLHTNCVLECCGKKVHSNAQLTKEVAAALFSVF